MRKKPKRREMRQRKRGHGRRSQTRREGEGERGAEEEKPEKGERGGRGGEKAWRKPKKRGKGEKERAYMVTKICMYINFSALNTERHFVVGIS